MSLPLKSDFHSSADCDLLLLLQLLIMNDEIKMIMIDVSWHIVIKIWIPKIAERKEMFTGERLRKKMIGRKDRFF